MAQMINWAIHTLSSLSHWLAYLRTLATLTHLTPEDSFTVPNSPSPLPQTVHNMQSANGAIVFETETVLKLLTYGYSSYKGKWDQALLALTFEKLSF